MPLSIGEKIKVLCRRRGVTLAELAEQTHQSRQNLSNKMKRDNFSEQEAIEIARILDCTFDASFIMNDTGERL